jgi:hypothetical protein
MHQPENDRDVLAVLREISDTPITFTATFSALVLFAMCQATRAYRDVLLQRHLPDGPMYDQLVAIVGVSENMMQLMIRNYPASKVLFIPAPAKEETVQ